MLSQPENRLNLREFMDEGSVLLIDLACLDSKVKQVLGCFILSLLHLNAISRSDTGAHLRKQFFIHCDEAHQFLTDAIENLIAETRKFGVSLTLVHQYLSQFSKKKIDALSTVGSAIIFSVDNRDAHYLAKDLLGKLAPDKLVALQKYEAVARIDTEVVKFVARPPQTAPKVHYKEQIIEQSRNRYCRSASEIRKWIRRRDDRWCKPFSPLTWGGLDTTCGDRKELKYDEFD
jgi:DNA helicase HerA-like ATPase